MLIESGIFEATPGNGLFMNEMLLSTGFMNYVTSLFVPKLCFDNHNKVAVANGPTNKNENRLCLLHYEEVLEAMFWTEQCGNF